MIYHIFLQVSMSGHHFIQALSYRGVSLTQHIMGIAVVADFFDDPFGSHLLQQASHASVAESQETGDFCGGGVK